MMADRHHVLSRRIDAAVNDSLRKQPVGGGLRRLGIEGEFEHVGGLDELRRARPWQEIAARIGRMPQAHVPEGIEHAFVRQDAARERKVVAEVGKRVGHGNSKAETPTLAKAGPV